MIAPNTIQFSQADTPQQREATLQEIARAFNEQHPERTVRVTATIDDTIAHVRLALLPAVDTKTPPFELGTASIALGMRVATAQIFEQIGLARIMVQLHEREMA